MPRRTRARQLATALTLLGIGLIVWGWVREGTTGYLPAMLLEIGATLALFAPLAYIGIGFERRVTAVQEATEELGGRVEEVRDEVRRALRLGELDDQIAERLALRREGDEQLADAVREDVTFDNLLSLLDRATTQRAVTSYGPRVGLEHVNDRLRFTPGQIEDGPRLIWIRLEDAAGVPTGVTAIWTANSSITNTWEVLVTNAQSLNRYPGETIFAPGPILDRLVEIASRGLRLRTDPGGSRDFAPLIELLAAGWALTDGGLEHIDDPPYVIEVERLINDEYLRDHMLEKTWIERDTVSIVLSLARAYHERRLERTRQLGQPQW